MLEVTLRNGDDQLNEVIEVSNLHKHCGETVAVDGVSFAVRLGEILGIIGPNGAGKPTISVRPLSSPTLFIFGKLRVQDRTAAVTAALEKGIISLDR